MAVNECNSQKAICISSIGTKTKKMPQRCNHTASAIHVDLWTYNSFERSIVLCQTKKNIAPGQNEESKQSRECQSGGCCSEQRLQWVVWLPQDQSFRETYLRYVRAKDDTENLIGDSPSQEHLTSSVDIQGQPITVYQLPPSWLQLLLPNDQVLCVCCWRWQWL